MARSSTNIEIGRSRSAVLPALAAVLGIAVAVGAILTLNQPRADEPRVAVSADLTPAEALAQAGRRAASAAPAALRAGEFHHVRTLDYVRDQSFAAASKQSVPNDPAGWVEEAERELWFDVDGNGREITISSAAAAARNGFSAVASPDPASSGDTRVIRDDRFEAGERAPESRVAMITGDDEADVFTRAVDAGVAHEPFADAAAEASWGVTVGDVTELPVESGSELDAAVATLIEAAAESRPGFSVASRPPKLQAAVAREYEINAAVRLLGDAPLAPAARQAVFNWLTSAPGAQFDPTRRDAEGRSGMAISFEQVTREQAPPTMVPGREARQEALQASPGARLRMARMRTERPGELRERTWRLSIIVDPGTGSLLQATRSERDVNTTFAFTPVPVGNGIAEARPTGLHRVGISEHRRVWLVNDRTRSAQPRPALCERLMSLCD